MRRRPLLGLVAAVILGVPVWIAAQQPPPQVTNPLPQGGRAPFVANNLPFDPKDLSGVWRAGLYGYNAKFEPKWTAEGKKKYDAQKPSYPDGFDPNSLAAFDTSVPPGRRRAVPPAIGNDKVGCNPLGLVRLLVYAPSPMEIVMTPNRIHMLFEWTWDHREIWTDGRKLPNPDDYLPRWNGYSVGRWEGDKLVVNTNGFDDRLWLDHFGYPISSKAALEERWKRTAQNVLTLNMSVTDPVLWKGAWPSDLVTFRLMTDRDVAQGTGWAGLKEDKCVPLDEIEFNRKVRNPAMKVPGTGQAPK